MIKASYLKSLGSITDYCKLFALELATLKVTRRQVAVKSYSIKVIGATLDLQVHYSNAFTTLEVGVCHEYFLFSHFYSLQGKRPWSWVIQSPFLSLAQLSLVVHYF